jgi:hypothetical protein
MATNQLTMLGYYTLLLLILYLFHFIDDFILQSDEMAINKSTSLKWLTIHSIVYGIPISIIAYDLVGLQFGIFNTLAHFLVDFFSSRMTSSFWKSGNRHWFFVTIGFDQLIHITTITLSFLLFFSLRILS